MSKGTEIVAQQIFFEHDSDLKQQKMFAIKLTQNWVHVLPFLYNMIVFYIIKRKEETI